MTATAKISLLAAEKGDFTVTSDGVVLHLCAKCGMPIPLFQHIVMIHGKNITVHPEIHCSRCHTTYSVVSGNITDETGLQVPFKE